jgi:hypothetical protein
VIDVGGSSEGVERGPSHNAPGPLGNAAGTPVNGFTLGSGAIERPALARKIKVEQPEAVVAGCAGEVFGEYPGVAADTGTLGYGRLDIDTNVHV